MGTGELHVVKQAYTDKLYQLRSQRPGHFVVPPTPPALEQRYQHFMSLNAQAHKLLDDALQTVLTSTDEDKDNIYGAAVRLRYTRTLVADVTNEIEALQNEARKAYEDAQLKNEQARVQAIAELMDAIELCSQELRARGYPQTGTAPPNPFEVWSNEITNKYKDDTTLSALVERKVNMQSPAQPPSGLLNLPEKDPALWDRIITKLKMKK